MHPSGAPVVKKGILQNQIVGFEKKGKSEIPIFAKGAFMLLCPPQDGEEAMYLTRFASKVKIIHRRDQLRAERLLQERAFRNEKIEFVWDSVVTEVVGEQSITGLRLRNVKTDEISDLSVTGLFMGIGHKPNTEGFAGQLELSDSGFIVTDSTRTSVAGVYAAGDVQDPLYKQAVTAAGTGCAAALEAERYLESLGQ